MMFGNYNLAGVKWSTNCDLSYNIVDSVNLNIARKPAIKEILLILLDFNSLGSFHPVLAPDKSDTLDLLFFNFWHVKYEELLEILLKTDAHHSSSAFNINVQCDNSLRHLLRGTILISLHDSAVSWNPSF